MANPEDHKETSEGITDIDEELSSLHAEVSQSIYDQSDEIEMQDASNQLKIENEQELQESDEKNDKISLLEKGDSWAYKEYLSGLEKHPEFSKYLQIYENNGKKYLIVPSLCRQGKENETYVNLIVYPLKELDGRYEISNQKLAATSNHYFSRKDGCLSVRLEENCYVSMNRWTGEITEVDPSQYKANPEEVLDSLGKLDNSKQFSECSSQMQQCAKEIIGGDKPLEQAQSRYEESRKVVVECIRKGDIVGAIKGIFKRVKAIIGDKTLPDRVLGIGKNLNYSGDEADIPYLESAINNIFDPEKRSEFTYLLSQIKDKATMSDLKSKGIENPTQFDLFLQNCESGQVLLTNGKDKSGGIFNFYDKFNQATQIVSGARWCHAAIISDIVRNSEGIVTDIKVIQANGKGVKEENSYREYLNGDYSSADFLVGSFPNENVGNNIISAARGHIGEEYDHFSVVMDAIEGRDVDDDGANVGGQRSYCSELVFDAMSKCGCEMPKPHIAPADLLASGDITPKYVCYCESF